MIKICPICEEEFPTLKTDKIYCSKECYKERKKRLSNTYRMEMRGIARELGNCTVCFKKKEDSEYLICAKCRKKIISAKKQTT